MKLVASNHFAFKTRSNFKSGCNLNLKRTSHSSSRVTLNIILNALSLARKIFHVNASVLSVKINTLLTFRLLTLLNPFPYRRNLKTSSKIFSLITNNRQRKKSFKRHETISFCDKLQGILIRISKFTIYHTLHVPFSYV